MLSLVNILLAGRSWGIDAESSHDFFDTLSGLTQLSYGSTCTTSSACNAIPRRGSRVCQFDLFVERQEIVRTSKFRILGAS